MVSLRVGARGQHRAWGLDSPRDDWPERAACKDADPDLFYPDRGDMNAIKQAKRICRRCPVQAECLADALARPAGDDYGICGGLSQRERLELRRRQLLAEVVRERFGPPPAKPPRPRKPCGTTAAYRRHKAHGEPVDDACVQAHRADARIRRREWRARQRAKTAVA